MNPGALFQHVLAQDAFENVRQLADGEQRQNGKIRKPAQAEGKADTAYPHKPAVEDKRDKGLSSGAQCEVGGVGKGLEGHDQGTDENQILSQQPYRFRCVLDMGEQAGTQSHQSTKQNAHGYGKSNELSVRVPHLLLRTAGAQHLAHEDSDADTQGVIHYTGQIDERSRDIHGGHHIQTAGGVALIHDGNAH